MITKLSFFGSILLLLSTLLSSACKSSTSTPIQSIPVLPTYADLAARWQHSEDTLYIINFWATTCPPCLEEMPHFAKLESEYGDAPVKVWLVSTDDKDQLESRVLPFITKHQITPEVVLLADDNYSAWTGKVDPSWYGALPATLMLRGDQRAFRFGKYTSYAELRTDVEAILK